MNKVTTTKKRKVVMREHLRKQHDFQKEYFHETEMI